MSKIASALMATVLAVVAAGVYLGRQSSRLRSAATRVRARAFWEVLVFLATVVVAYVYAWRRGVFRWR